MELCNFKLTIFFQSYFILMLIFKLEFYEISGHLLAWIKAFLTNRLKRVEVGNCLSSLINVISGVPMAVCWGSILFIIYINDISDFLRVTQ